VVRSHRAALAGIATALLSNYWVLEGLLAKRTDPSGSWISDLAARTEAFGWRFELLEIASGLAAIGFAVLLLRGLGELSPLLRRGVVALAVEGGLTVVGGATPLSCAEGLADSCSLDYDALDVIHATAEFAATAATILAFGLIALGLNQLGRRSAARAILAIGGAWLVLAVLTGLSFLSGDVDSVKGIVQRAGQVLFGAWLVLLGLWDDGVRAGRRPS
jgi:Protein of unknown function (DUF998)